MKKMLLKPIFLFLLICQISQLAVGQSISVFGNWNYSIPTNDLTEAGANFTGTYSSDNNQATVNISNGFFGLFINYNWRVDIKRIDIDWNSNLRLYARRTGVGSSASFYNGAVNGSGAFQQLTTSNQLFFTGNGSRSNIPIQYQIRNVSLLLPAKSYETTIIYTVTDN